MAKRKSGIAPDKLIWGGVGVAILAALFLVAGLSSRDLRTAVGLRGDEVGACVAGLSGECFETTAAGCGTGSGYPIPHDEPVEAGDGLPLTSEDVVAVGHNPASGYWAGAGSSCSDFPQEELDGDLGPYLDNFVVVNLNALYVFAGLPFLKESEVGDLCKAKLAEGVLLNENYGFWPIDEKAVSISSICDEGEVPRLVATKAENPQVTKIETDSFVGGGNIDVTCVALVECVPVEVVPVVAPSQSLVPLKASPKLLPRGFGF